VSEEAKLEDETLDLIFKLSKGVPADQLQASDSVDSKTFQAFAAASVLIGLATIRGPRHDNLETAFLAAAVAAFVSLAAVAIWALWTREYRVGISPDQLWREFWAETPRNIKHAHVTDTASGYPENDGILRSKHRRLRFVLIMLVIEAGAIGAALIVSAVRA
jgi:hypothetical protein